MRRTGNDARAVRLVVAAFGAVMLAAAVASAQARPPAPKAPGPPRFEIGGGAWWLGGYDLGTRDAVLTGNADTPGGALVLFRTASEIAPGPGLEIQVGYRLAERLVAESAFAYDRPELRTSISGDAEQAPAAVASDRLSQYVFSGAVRVHVLDGRRPGRRLSPFVLGGAGYLRQLTSDTFTVESGTIVFAGGGLTWTLGSRPSGFGRAWGARVDARFNWRTGGIDVEDTGRSWPSVGGGLFARF